MEQLIRIQGLKGPVNWGRETLHSTDLLVSPDDLDKTRIRGCRHNVPNVSSDHGIRQVAKEGQNALGGAQCVALLSGPINYPQYRKEIRAAVSKGSLANLVKPVIDSAIASSSTAM
jgi:hypothetical protein